MIKNGRLKSRSGSFVQNEVENADAGSVDVANQENMQNMNTDNLPLLSQSGDETQHSTLFGFATKNVFASKCLNLIYIIVMLVATAFAFHALSLILTGWNPGLILMAAVSVVGLPYCIKIIMYGRETFEYKHAMLCLIISLLPTIFDFVGLYSETSVKASLQSTKFEVLEKVNFFDKEVRKSINKQIIMLESETSKLKNKTEQDFVVKTNEANNLANSLMDESDKQFSSSIKDLNSKVNESEQAYVDETEGVRGKSTSGVSGMGPRAKELQADVRKAKSEVDIAKKELETNKAKQSEALKNKLTIQEKELESLKNKELEKIEKEYQIKKSSYDQGVQAIDGLVSNMDGEDGLIFSVNKAKTFEELADVSVKLNGAINVISSKIGTEPEFIKFKTDNVINLSFGALIRGDVTALVCFLLAMLLEIVDTVIVYTVRGTRIKKISSTWSDRKTRETIKYDF